MAENLISLKNLLPRIKHHMLSYPIHFLKIGGYLFWINFLGIKYTNPNLKHDKMISIHYFLQIKQNLSIFI